MGSSPSKSHSNLARHDSYQRYYVPEYVAPNSPKKKWKQGKDGELEHLQELYYRNVEAGGPPGGHTIVPHPHGYVPALSPALSSPYGYVPATRTPTITTTGSASTHNPLPTPPRDLYAAVPHIASDHNPTGPIIPPHSQHSYFYSDGKKDKKSRQKHSRSYSGGGGDRKSSKESIGIPIGADHSSYFLSGPPAGAGPMMWQLPSGQASTWGPHGGPTSPESADIPTPPPPVVTGWQPATFIASPLGGPPSAGQTLSLPHGTVPLSRSATVPGALHASGSIRQKEKEKEKPKEEKKKKKGGLSGLFRSLTHSSSKNQSQPRQEEPTPEVVYPELQTSPVIGYTATGVPVHAPPGTIITSAAPGTTVQMPGLEPRPSTKTKRDKQRASAPPTTSAPALVHTHTRTHSQTRAAHKSAPPPATSVAATAPTPLAQMPLLQPPASAMEGLHIGGDSPAPPAPPSKSPHKSHRQRQRQQQPPEPVITLEEPIPEPPPTSSKPPPINFGPGSRPYSSFALVSPHAVLYKNKLYPTAAHLFEALKFLKKSPRPELAERIREIDDVVEMYQFVGTIPIGDSRPDWTSIFFAKLDATNYEKMTQRSDIRQDLLATGSAELRYDVPESFWGVQPDGTGENVLGKSLERVRTRILRETANAAAEIAEATLSS